MIEHGSHKRPHSVQTVDSGTQASAPIGDPMVVATNYQACAQKAREAQRVTLVRYGVRDICRRKRSILSGSRRTHETFEVDHRDHKRSTPQLALPNPHSPPAKTTFPASPKSPRKNQIEKTKYRLRDVAPVFCKDVDLGCEIKKNECCNPYGLA